MLRPPAYPFPVHTLTLFNNCELSYMDVGSGSQTIVFIHGLANYGASWVKNMTTLSKHYRCIAIDLPGNGLSGLLKTYSIGEFARCVIDFVGRMGLHNVCLAGHSMGGQIALRVALEAPFAASKLVLFAPAGFEQFTDLDRMLYQGSMQYMSWVSNDAYNLEQTLFASFYRFPESARKMIKDLIALMQRQSLPKYREMVDQCVQAMLQEPVFRNLPNVRQPSLVLFGERDALIPNKIIHPVSTKQVAQEGTRQLRDATLKIVPDCGHFLQWEKADEVNAAIEEWLG